MNRTVPALELLFCLALVLQVSCTGEQADHSIERGISRASRPMVLNEHGLKAGAVIDSIELPCNDGRTRVVAPADQFQLVTFSGPGDCSTCWPHLTGLKEISAAQGFRVEHIYVSFPAGMPVHVAARIYEPFTDGPVCWDEDGALWREHDIAHTPVTVLLRRGSIVLMHDAPLTSDDARSQLTDSIRVLRGREGASKP